MERQTAIDESPCLHLMCVKQQLLGTVVNKDKSCGCREANFIYNISVRGNELRL